eukprot:11162974-Alexandrium_andersonii.AAC.1
MGTTEPEPKTDPATELAQLRQAQQALEAAGQTGFAKGVAARIAKLEKTASESMGEQSARKVYGQAAEWAETVRGR